MSSNGAPTVFGKMLSKGIEITVPRPFSHVKLKLNAFQLLVLRVPSLFLIFCLLLNVFSYLEWYLGTSFFLLVGKRKPLVYPGTTNTTTE